jgi:hypothetical protein
MHAEIMAYLTDYGSLSSEKAKESTVSRSGNSFDGLVHLTVTELPVQANERATSGNDTRPDSDPSAAIARSNPDDWLSLGLPLYWPDAFGA